MANGSPYRLASQGRRAGASRAQQHISGCEPESGDNPIHTFHLGLWFNSPADASNAGCPADVTPFNGEHNAGFQVLNTSNFPDLQGPSFLIKP